MKKLLFVYILLSSYLGHGKLTLFSTDSVTTFSKSGLSNVATTTFSKLEYFVDTDPGYDRGTTINLNGQTTIDQTFNLDLSALNLPQGIHSIGFRLKDSNGKWSITHQKTFITIGTNTTSGSKLEYFVDTDPGYDRGTTINLNGQTTIDQTFNLDLSALNLPQGIHFIGFRMKDSNGKWSITHQKTFITIGTNTTSGSKLEYFVDTDPGYDRGTTINLNGLTTIDQTFNLDLSALNLPQGIHSIGFRMKDSNGKWSITHQKTFITIGTNTTSGSKLEYFVDTDPGYDRGTAINLNGQTTIDQNYNIDLATLNLPKGIHSIGFRMKDSNGKWSLTHQKIFLLFSNPSGSSIAKLEYFLDGQDPGYDRATNIAFSPNPDNRNVLASLNMPTTQLSAGSHLFSVRAKDSDGNWSIVKTDTFSLVPPIDITTGLIAHYQMDGDTRDASGNGNHGTAQNGVTFGTDRFGVAGKAASFDGTSWINVPNSSSLVSMNQNITISAWFNKNTNNDLAILCKSSTGTSNGYPIQFRIYYNNGSWSFVATALGYSFSGNLSNLQWYHVVAIKNGDVAKLFINGSLVGTVNSSSSAPYIDTYDLEIGRDRHGVVEYYNGLLDDVRLYNRALTDADMKHLYELESKGMVEIKPTASLQITPLVVPLGGNKYLEGNDFAANATTTINITRNTPGLPVSPIITRTDNKGKFSGVLLPNNDLGASFRVVATDAGGNSAVISYNTSDNTNYAKVTYPFKGSIIQATASAGNTITLKWDDKITLTNSVASSGVNRTVTYIVNYKAFNDVDWSADIIKTKTLPFGDNSNITDNLILPGVGTYIIRIKHQNVNELWNVTDNITIQAGDNIQVSYYNKRFISSNAIKGIVADGISRMQINCVLPASPLSIKRVIVTLQDPTANKTTREILGILVDGRNLTESQVEADDYNPPFNLSTTFSNIQNRTWSMWYLAPTDFSDGTAFTSDKIRNVKLKFEIVYDQNGIEVSEIKNHDIQIARPPLMMLGGIGLPATDTWEKFNSYMTNYGGLYMYSVEQGVVNFNPGGDANGSSSFKNNAVNILTGNDSYGKKSYNSVRKIMTDLGFVCSRVDVLTHGMGSSVVHASMLLNSGTTFFNNSDTYKKGYVNKFISLNAEKNGTPLIDLVEALLKEANKNPITADDLNSTIDFVKEYKIATPHDRKLMKDAIKAGAAIKGKALSYLTTRYLIYYTLANLELPFVGHLVKRVPRTKPQPITIPKRDEFLNELGNIEELNEWFEYLPRTFSSISINNFGEKFDELTQLPDLSRLNVFSKAKNALLSSADYAGAYLGYYLKSDSLIVSDAANELRNNETDIINRTLLTPVPLPTSGIHYLVGDLVGGNQENLLSATDWLIEKNEYVERYSKMLDAVSGVFEKIDELSDYKYLVNKTQYQSMRDELKARNGTNTDKKKLYNKWYNANRVPFLSDQSKIEGIQDILKLLEIPSLVFNYVKTGAEALSFVFNSDGIATTASQSATNTVAGLNASSVTRFPTSFESSDPFEGIVKYNYFSMPSNFSVYLRIVELLNSSINSNSFTKTIAQPFYGPSGFNPLSPTTANLTAEPPKKSGSNTIYLQNTNALFIKNLTDTSTVKIVTPLANSSISVGSKMEVRVNLKDTTNFNQLELSFQGQKYYQVEKTKNSVFYINIDPSEETELLQVTAKYRLGVDSSLHISDRLRVTPLNTEAIQKITPLQEVIYVKKGQFFTQSCFLTYQSYETYMTADPRFSFAFTNSGIITFDNTTGFFKALQVGTTEVTGTYKNVNFNFVIIVEDLPLSIVPVTIYNNACLGRNINVSLIKNGFTDTNTNYFLELSNENGNFVNPTILFTGTNVQNQTVTLPNNIVEGSNYQIRVRTDTPSYISTENIVMSLHNGGMLKSVKTGYWNDPSTWSCGQLPIVTDTPTISNGHTVTLPSGQSGFVKNLILYGTFTNLGNFNTGSN